MADPNKPWTQKEKGDFSAAFNKGPSGKEILEKIAGFFGGGGTPAQADDTCPNCGQTMPQKDESGQ